MLFNLRLNPGETTCSAHKFSATLPFCDDITQNTSTATCSYNWLHFHLWFVSNPAVLCFSIRCGVPANGGERVKPWCVLIGRDGLSASQRSFLLSSLLYNHRRPFESRPWSMDLSDKANRVPNRLCHLSPHNQKQTVLLLFCWE